MLRLAGAVVYSGLNPLKSGHFFRPMGGCLAVSWCLGLNPLKSGHFFRPLEDLQAQMQAMRLNPLKSGHFFRLQHSGISQEHRPKVSIPSNRGISSDQLWAHGSHGCKWSLNPLKSGHFFRLWFVVEGDPDNNLSQSPQIGAFLQTQRSIILLLSPCPVSIPSNRGISSDNVA